MSKFCESQKKIGQNRFQHRLCVFTRLNDVIEVSSYSERFRKKCFWIIIQKMNRSLKKDRSKDVPSRTDLLRYHIIC